MIMRLFLVLGLVLLGGTAYFIVIQQPPTVQLTPAEAEVTRLQATGILPQGDIDENEDVEHGIFEVPAMDEMMLESAMKNMEGMTMPGMSMDNGSGTMPMDNGSGTMAMAMGCNSEDGLTFCSADAPADREITLSMSEWRFDNLNVEVKKGERIRFTIRNAGKTLHEFMFMSMAAMQAVNYRAKRADWSLLEHEALFEQSLLLPGQEISFVVEVQQPGSWMFMCMLPYHMQMGMMGQIATPGAAMQM